MPQRRHDPTLDDLHSGFNLGLVARFVRPRGQHAHAVVHGQFVISAVEVGLVATGAIHAGTSVVGDDQFGNTTQEFKSADVRTNPVLQFLALGGFGISVVAGSQDGDEDGGLALRPALRIMNRNRRPGVIDEQFLSRDMILAQHDIQLLSPTLVQFAKAAVSVTIRVGLPIFFPGELERQVRMALEFFVELGKIRLRLAGWVGVPRGSGKYGRYQLAIIPAFRQWPTDLRLPSASQVFRNRALRDRATAGDLVLPQPQFVAQTQYFFELSHGQPFHGQCGPSTFQWNLTARDVVQRPSLSLIPESTGPGPYPPRSNPCGNHSEMIPITIPTTR